ncbi:hypothetical protein ABEB36_006264 [Hypothenemus hampei]
MNLSVNPCDDFYEYTCGNFQNAHPLQDNEELIDYFTLLESSLTKIGNDILKNEISTTDPVALQKAKAAYQACVSEDLLDTVHLINPEIQVIEQYNGFPILGANNLENESFGWNEIADLASEFGISIFFTPVLTYDTLNASRNVLRISTDPMEIPTQFRPMLSQTYEEAIEKSFIVKANQKEKLTSYKVEVSAMEILLRQLVLKMKKTLGSSRSDSVLYDSVANVYSFLTGISNGGYIDENATIGAITDDPYAISVTLKQLNEWTIQNFGDTIQLDWVEYVKRLLQYTYVDVDENFLVLHPNGLNQTLYGILNWVRMNDIEIVKSAALLRAFTYTAADSDSETRNYFETFLNSSGKIIFPRWEYCSRKIMDSTGTLSLGLAVAYDYQLNQFDKTKLEKVAELISNIQTNFKVMIEESDWMDDTSKAAAQIKANNIINLLGFPEFILKQDLLDHFYDNLEITTWNHYSNAKKIRAFQQSYTLNMISERNRYAWEKSPFDVNAYYNRQNNRIIFPIAMLNPIFFRGSLNELDYGRFGMIIAHEITHGFDGQGYLYNPDGVIKPWWGNETKENFSNRIQCFIDQYSNYSIPEINATLSGSGSLNENIADNGGLRNAYGTFKKLFNSTNDVYNISGYQVTQEQLFFVGYGTMWCNSESISYLNSLVNTCNTTSSCHARASMRVNGVVSNMEEFGEAFGCPTGSAMNPTIKCKLW